MIHSKGGGGEARLGRLGEGRRCDRIQRGRIPFDPARFLGLAAWVLVVGCGHGTADGSGSAADPGARNGPKTGEEDSKMSEATMKEPTNEAPGHGEEEGGIGLPGAGADGALPPPEAGSREALLRAGLLKAAQEGRVNLDGPIAAYLPVFTGQGLSVLTPRQVIEHTAHLGGAKYEEWMEGQASPDPLTSQAFLGALGMDDTPGQRPVWRLAHVHAMEWLVEALGIEVK